MLTTRLLRLLLLALLPLSVLAQVAIPGVALEVGGRFPEVAHLVIPYSAAAILFIGCVQVTLVAIWRLLSFVDGGIVFSGRSERWVDLVIGCGSVGTVLTAIVLVHMWLFVPGGGGPTLFFMIGCLVGSLAFVLLMVVTRRLLRSAVADRARLDQPA